MSEVKDKFYELFAPKMAANGFVFKKSAGKFVKTEGEVTFVLNFRWDGRGGTSIIDGIGYWVVVADIEKTYKKQTGNNGTGWHLSGNIPLLDANMKLIIPVMYTQAVLDLANKMNFKALAQIPFEEKYPIERINNCVNRVEKLIELNVFPFFQKYDSEAKVYAQLCTTYNETVNKADIFSITLEIMKLYAEKLGLPDFENLK